MRDIGPCLCPKIANDSQLQDSIRALDGAANVYFGAVRACNGAGGTEKNRAGFWGQVKVWVLENVNKNVNRTDGEIGRSSIITGIWKNIASTLKLEKIRMGQTLKKTDIGL